MPGGSSTGLIRKLLVGGVSRRCRSSWLRGARARMEKPVQTGDVIALHLGCRGSRRKSGSSGGSARSRHSRDDPLSGFPRAPPQGLTPSSAMNDDVLDRWIEAFRGPLVGLVASWSNDWREAEEVAQDALAEAWVGRDRFEGDPEDLGRRAPGCGGSPSGSAARRAVELVCAWSAAARRTVPWTSRAAHRREDPRMEALRSAFGELSSEHQSVLRMRYLEPTSNREVAALLGRTEKAVEHLLRRARKELHRLAERRLDPTEEDANDERTRGRSHGRRDERTGPSLVREDELLGLFDWRRPTPPPSVKALRSGSAPGSRKQRGPWMALLHRGTCAGLAPGPSAAPPRCSRAWA